MYFEVKFNFVGLFFSVSFKGSSVSQMFSSPLQCCYSRVIAGIGFIHDANRTKIGHKLCQYSLKYRFQNCIENIYY